MRSQMVKRGFTLIELLVVIAIIAILASILFPVFAKAREKARQTTCTSQVRQLATAIQMYVQDNNSRYPGVVPNYTVNPNTLTSSWTDAIDNYVGAKKLYFCPSDAANDKAVNAASVSYGYSGLLVRTDGQGLNEAQVKAPTEVGAIADATPSRDFSEAGLIGGGALLSANNPASVQLDPNRHTGVIVGFCDGHAKYFPGKQPNLRSIDNPLSRAFYQAVGLGLVQNFGGGIEFQTGRTFAPASTVSVGGDYAVMPIVMAAAEIWTAKGGKYYARGFKGWGDIAERDRIVTAGNYVWANASGTAGAVGASSVVGYDALVIITSLNCKIDGLAGFTPPGVMKPGDNTAMATVNIAKPFQTAGGTAPYTTPGFSMATGAHWQAYTYRGTSGANPVEYNGNTLFFNRMVLGGGRVGSSAVRVQDDAEMVEKVSADPYGIGFCSSAFADTSKVTILDIVVGTQTMFFPNPNDKYRWTMPDNYSDVNYPLKRELRVETGLTGGFGVSQFMCPANWVTFKSGPLYQASYWAQ